MKLGNKKAHETAGQKHEAWMKMCRESAPPSTLIYLYLKYFFFDKLFILKILQISGHIVTNMTTSAMQRIIRTNKI